MKRSSQQFPSPSPKKKRATQNPAPVYDTDWEVVEDVDFDTISTGEDDSMNNEIFYINTSMNKCSETMCQYLAKWGIQLADTHFIVMNDANGFADEFEKETIPDHNDRLYNRYMKNQQVGPLPNIEFQYLELGNIQHNCELIKKALASKDKKQAMIVSEMTLQQHSAARILSFAFALNLNVHYYEESNIKYPSDALIHCLTDNDERFDPAQRKKRTLRADFTIAQRNVESSYLFLTMEIAKNRIDDLTNHKEFQKTVLMIRCKLKDIVLRMASHGCSVDDIQKVVVFGVLQSGCKWIFLSLRPVKAMKEDKEVLFFNYELHLSDEMDIATKQGLANVVKYLWNIRNTVEQVSQLVDKRGKIEYDIKSFAGDTPFKRSITQSSATRYREKLTDAIKATSTVRERLFILRNSVTTQEMDSNLDLLPPGIRFSDMVPFDLGSAVNELLNAHFVISVTNSRLYAYRFLISNQNNQAIVFAVVSKKIYYSLYRNADVLDNIDSNVRNNNDDLEDDNSGDTNRQTSVYRGPTTKRNRGSNSQSVERKSGAYSTQQAMQLKVETVIMHDREQFMAICESNIHMPKVFVKVLAATVFPVCDVMQHLVNIDHPNIYKVYHYKTNNRKCGTDIEELPGNLPSLGFDWFTFEVTEYLVDAFSCFGRIACYQAVPIAKKMKTLCSIFRDCLAALQKLKEEHLVHGDISITNVMFRVKNSETNGQTEYVPVLIDFTQSSIVKFNNASVRTGTRGYTPHVKQLSYRTDLFSMGVVFAEYFQKMTTGMWTFSSIDSDIDFWRAIATFMQSPTCSQLVGQYSQIHSLFSEMITDMMDMKLDLGIDHYVDLLDELETSVDSMV